jgi:hypothetical protein
MGKPTSSAAYYITPATGNWHLGSVYKTLPPNQQASMKLKLNQRIAKHSKTYMSVNPTKNESLPLVKCNGSCYYVDYQTFALCKGDTSCLCNNYIKYMYGPYGCPY